MVFNVSDQNIERFRRRYQGSEPNLLLVGGTYNEPEAKKLRSTLGVRIDRKNWISTSPSHDAGVLDSRVKKADLVLCFIRHVGHGYYYKARDVAKQYGVPFVASRVLNPAVVAGLFLNSAGQ